MHLKTVTLNPQLYPTTEHYPFNLDLFQKSQTITFNSPVTFFVDNRSCRAPLDVYIDGARLGQVAANAKAAFQTLAGRHAMCLIPTSGGATCGQKGTVRTAHIHDGWSISMHCVVKQARK